MTSVFRLYGISEIREDLGFYMMHGVINANASESMNNVSIKLVREMAKNVDFLMSCMNIADAAQQVPIARDYLKYNSSPNFGEIQGAKL
mmetsp:Transcript_25732/g.18214  ORF Transcript_25732/g.18214 Transcript_25732/m.18214 type:complete len:89 (+) Transcript_25732:1595-1861(+)